MKIYRYETRNIVEFDDGTRISLATKKYGDTLEQITKQIYETKYKLGNAYNILEDVSVEILYWNKKELKTVSIYLDYEDWFKYKELTFTLNTNGYAWAWGKGATKRQFLHRMILGLTDEDYQNGILVDHKDGIKTNCRRNNLRIADFEINAKNQPYLNEHNISTGIRGISYTSDKTGYRVRWQENGKEKNRIFGLNELDKAIEFNKKIRKENKYIIREENN